MAPGFCQVKGPCEGGGAFVALHELYFESCLGEVWLSNCPTHQRGIAAIGQAQSGALWRRSGQHEYGSTFLDAAKKQPFEQIVLYAIVDNHNVSGSCHHWAAVNDFCTNSRKWQSQRFSKTERLREKCWPEVRAKLWVAGSAISMISKHRKTQFKLSNTLLMCTCICTYVCVFQLCVCVEKMPCAW